MDEGLIRRDKNCWPEISEEEKRIISEFCNDYLDFLSLCKTERECVEYMEELAVEAGYQEADEKG